MGFQKLLGTAAAVVVLGFVVAAPSGASVSNHTMYLTFTKPVGLPGVALGSGTYIFEVPDGGDHSVVRVLSRDRRTVYYTGFTDVIQRPHGLRAGTVVSFAEAASNRPQPISVWWTEDAAGRKFIYQNR
jgi:hypothetical protein